jgi:predicted RNA binding protein YcfA (HicA-like mRNA interferase family)
MPRKIKQLIKDLESAGFQGRDGKGSHRNFFHTACPFIVTISGKDGDDAMPYQEKAVKQALREIKK